VSTIVESAVSKLDGQREEGQREYAALVSRLFGGGEVTEGDRLVLLMGGKSEADLSRDLENEIARAADDEAGSEAQRIRRDLVPRAQQQAAEVAVEVQATEAFASGFLGALQAERDKAANYSGYLAGVARELASGPNSRALHHRRERAKALRAQQQERPPAWMDSDIHLEAGRRVLAAAMENELGKLAEPCSPSPIPVVRASDVKSLTEIVAAAVAALSAEQRQVMRAVAVALLDTTSAAETPM
jgi:hypothetical protein